MSYKLTGAINVTHGKSYPYWLIFNVKGTEIKGYSVTRLKDGTEPKTAITGVINKKKNTLDFSETTVDSDEKNTITCFVFASLSYKADGDKNKVCGIFKGKDINGIHCGEGTIDLEMPDTPPGLFTVDKPKQPQVKDPQTNGSQQKEKTVKEQQGGPQQKEKVTGSQQANGKHTKDAPAKKPQSGDPAKKPGSKEQADGQSKKTPAAMQHDYTKHNPESMDESGEYEITSGIKMQFNWYSDTCVIDLYDGGVIDGDMITLVYNGKEILPKHLLTKKKHQVRFFLTDKVNTVSFIADNLGKTPPNTSNMILTDGKRHYKIKAFNDIGESAEIILNKQ